MPTAVQIDLACRGGLFVYAGNRQRVMGASTHLETKEAAKDHVWVYWWSKGYWDEVLTKSVIITTELVQKKEEGMTLEAVGKKSGKRGGAGHTSSPSESAARAAEAKGKKKPAKGDATSSLKDLGEIVGNGKDAAPTEAGKKASKGKWKPKSSVSLAKQGELPGVKTSERIDKAIESLAERFEETKLAKAAADKDHKESDELLVALMRRKKRTRYSRKTWGEVIVPEPVIHAKFKREKKKAKK